jgi:hypothetical protein
MNRAAFCKKFRKSLTLAANRAKGPDSLVRFVESPTMCLRPGGGIRMARRCSRWSREFGDDGGDEVRRGAA